MIETSSSLRYHELNDPNDYARKKELRIMNEGIEYKKLLVAYEALQMENLALKGEVDALRRQLGLLSTENSSEVQIPAPEEINRELIASEESALVHRHSPSDKKIALFMSLFRGRDDVYAKRWESKKTGKSGYQPVCANELLGIV